MLTALCLLIVSSSSAFADVFTPTTTYELQLAVGAWKNGDRSTYGDDINAWNTSLITKMWALFYNYDDFNDYIGGWDVSNVTSMSRMFKGAHSFNQDIGGWDVSNVVDMREMFNEVSSFCQDLCWDVHPSLSNSTLPGILPGPRFSQVVGSTCTCAADQTLNTSSGHRGICEGTSTIPVPEKSCEPNSGLGSLRDHASIIILFFVVIIFVKRLYACFCATPRKQSKDTSTGVIKPLLYLYMMLLLATFDFVTDVAVYINIARRNLFELPCNFGGIGDKVECSYSDEGFADHCACKNMDIHYDNTCYFNDASDTEEQTFYEALGQTFQRSCILHMNPYQCDCRNFNGWWHFVGSINFIFYFACTAFAVLCLKEIFKIFLLVKGCFIADYRRPGYFKYALNSPLCLFMVACSKSYRELSLETSHSLNQTERPYNILVDLIFEDLPGLVVPCWYMYHSEPSFVQVASLYTSCLSITFHVSNLCATFDSKSKHDGEEDENEATEGDVVELKGKSGTEKKQQSQKKKKKTIQYDDTLGLENSNPDLGLHVELSHM